MIHFTNTHYAVSKVQNVPLKTVMVNLHQKHFIFYFQSGRIQHIQGHINHTTHRIHAHKNTKSLGIHQSIPLPRPPMEQLLLPWINLFPPSILPPKRPFPTTSTQLHSNQFTRVNLAAGRTKVHKLRMAEGEKKI